MILKLMASDLDMSVPALALWAKQSGIALEDRDHCVILNGMAFYHEGSALSYLDKCINASKTWKQHL